jgi:phenylalanyl-tRNA synthetase beta chain
MDIKISDNWLREYLKTDLKPKQIGEQLALCGPSVEKVTKLKNDYVYDIEVTTNRVDCMSVMGIAREASAILPGAKLKKRLFDFAQSDKETLWNDKAGKDLLHIKIDPKLVNRVMAVVMDLPAGRQGLERSPRWMVDRLENSGMRALNPIVDITNYVMQEIGHPTHVFDYDLLKEKQLIFRPSDKNEEITSFDGKTYKLSGDDIVIDDGEGNIIDLPGIIGTKNSVVNKNSKRIIFFIDNNDPLRIRKTSTRLGIRTNAAILNEKGVDPELASVAFQRGIELCKEICKAKIISKIYDIYPKVYRGKVVKVYHKFIEKIIGIQISNKKVIEILTKLGFEIKFDSAKALYLVKAPSWRANDVAIPEDIVEEVARIYGYHNLPSEIMTGRFPEPVLNMPFDFENKIKNILKGYGGVETYTNSLVPKDFVKETALKLKNPLGEDTKYLRTNLKPSLIVAAKENAGEKEPFYLFEVANVYMKRDPYEKMMLGVIFSNYSYRKAKGVIEALYEELNERDSYTSIGMTIVPDSPYVYFEIEVDNLRKNAKDFPTYVSIPKYPAQIEDITLTFPAKTKIGDVIKVFEKAELVDIFSDSYTFRVWYQDIEKTLTDEEVEKIRNKYLKELKDKFGGSIKN